MKVEIGSVVGVSEIHVSSFDSDPSQVIDREPESIENPQESKKAESKDHRIAVVITGIVQSVGFRPFVHRLAVSLGLTGFVKNQSSEVYIEAQGDPTSLSKFVEDLKEKSPALARIISLQVFQQEPKHSDEFGDTFMIETSEAASIERGAPSVFVSVFISPDIATCDECLAELFDPKDRRFRYPFLNCVNCGPRLTIIESSPYDRINTTMRNFPLCRDCDREYNDPSDRRFHAQPTACSTCGPNLRAIEMNTGETTNHDVLQRMAEILKQGGIVALKSLGGYHLACDATNPSAIKELRRRKNREEKPLAIMVKDITTAHKLCHISPAEAAALESRARPIVLLKKRRTTATQTSTETGAGADLGILLPYTPLHALLMDEMNGCPLVMTSGNESDSPIAWNDEDALDRLSGVADLLVTHDRPIRVRCDDSVLKILESPKGPESSAQVIPIFIRRSRGYVPEALPLPFAISDEIFAAGSQMKNTFALAKRDHVILSHHIGDLDRLATFEAYAREISLYERLFALQPRVLACDLHPNYMSSRYAEERAQKEGLNLIHVQHHHAHVASCMADNGLDETVIGVAFDGTGYGTDGKIWGGEFLVADYAGFERAAHFNYIPMPGGERAILEPWRIAEAYANHAGLPWESNPFEIPARDRSILQSAIAKRLNCPLTSSVGRLFDAVAALLGVRSHIRFDGQAAMEIEWLASDSPKCGSYPIHLTGKEGPIVLDTTPLIRGILADLASGVDRTLIACRFHSSLAEVICRVCERIRTARSLNRVALSGGVFLNRRLLEEARQGLCEKGFEVYSHRSAPPNDGGLSLGQIAVAAAMIRETEKKGSHRCV